MQNKLCVYITDIINEAGVSVIINLTRAASLRRI